MNAFLSKFMLYYEIKRMYRDGRSISKISEALNCNRRTVKKYLEMEDQEFESFLNAQSNRGKLLLPYEGFVRDRLEVYRDTPAAQMHDWLKEHQSEFPLVNQKTVFNFVKWVRRKHNLPYEPPIRDYAPVQETPYGLQAQVDFGEYNMRCSDGRRVKVYFFTMVLSRSRFKYVCFTSRPFTSHSAILAHESAFKYMGGIPVEVVYDQDKVFISNENSGELILTSQFKTYVRDRGFTVHMCRKADPESKGKIENVVKYVKQNFLYNRIFYDLETLNTDGLNWLERTANKLTHGQTKKIPAAEWLIEQPFLHTFDAVAIAELPPLLYAVRKDNTISYKSNLYSLPLGTYRGRGTQVSVCSQEGNLIIYSQNKAELCRHAISKKSGMKIINTDHKRDKTEALEGLIESVCNLTDDKQRMHAFISGIRTDKPRYVRDQLLIIKEALTGSEQQEIVRALTFCLEHGINSANDFKTLLKKFGKKSETEVVAICTLNPLNGTYPVQALVQPGTSRIEDYQRLLNPQLN
jgi:transposase